VQRIWVLSEYKAQTAKNILCQAQGITAAGTLWGIVQLSWGEYKAQTARSHPQTQGILQQEGCSVQLRHLTSD
jgi:hypothetical protein